LFKIKENFLIKIDKIAEIRKYFSIFYLYLIKISNK